MLFIPFLVRTADSHDSCSGCCYHGCYCRCFLYGREGGAFETSSAPVHLCVNVPAGTDAVRCKHHPHALRSANYQRSPAVTGSVCRKRTCVWFSRTFIKHVLGAFTIFLVRFRVWYWRIVIILQSRHINKVHFCCTLKEFINF